MNKSLSIKMFDGSDERDCEERRRALTGAFETGGGFIKSIRFFKNNAFFSGKSAFYGKRENRAVRVTTGNAHW